MRIRTIPEAARELKTADPNCGITAWSIRSMVKEGTLPNVRVGKKFLVDLDLLERLFVPAEQTTKENKNQKGAER